MSVIIGKAIFELLSNYSGITSITGLKIYPVVAPENTTLPAIIYKRSSTPEYTRDGLSMSISDVEITTISTDYEQSVDIAASVFDVLNFYKGPVSGNNIVDIRLTRVEENFTQSAYLQEMTFMVRSY